MTILRFIRRHPALSYFSLVIAWSFPYMWVVLTLLPLDPESGPTPLQILLIGLGTSPSLFGVLLAYLSGGREALGDLFARLGRWRVPLVWYAAALLTVPALNVVSYLLYVQSGGQTYTLPSGPLAFAIPAGIMTGVLEELGWRGFALPALQKRHSALVSSLILGIAWGIWHLPLFYLQRAHYGAVAVPILILESLLSLTAITVLMTWVHNNTRQSLLLMVLFHLSLTGGNFLLQPPASSTGAEYLRFHMVSVVVQWSVVAVVVMWTGAKYWTPKAGHPV